jgi:membrane protease YdiL (CAAX protease family)
MATRWALFAGATLIVLLVVLGLSRATARELTKSDDPPSRSSAGTLETAPGDDGENEFNFVGRESVSQDVESRIDGDQHALEDRPYAGVDGATGEPNLLLSSALSQALVGTLLAGLAWYAEVPPSALGVDDPAAAMLPGIALGVGLYTVNEAGAWVAERAGVGADEALRELLAPETRGEWALLLLVVLPLVASVEELLFRGALIGGLAAGFSISPWLLAVLSSVAFGLGHGLQGPGGILVTGALGFVLAATFIITGSLWVVILTHYLVNALEFVVHEGFGVD